MARKIAVEILGDSTSLERAFLSSARSAQRFNQQLGGSGVASTLNTQASAVKGIVEAEQELIKVRSKRASSIGPLKLSGVGLAAGLGLFAATQAARELGQRLETVGTAALTTEGRLKNMVSALTSGNLVGAFTALTRGAESIEEIGKSTTAISPQRVKALEQVAAGVGKTMGGLDASKADIEKLKAIYNLAGTSSAKLAKEILAIVQPLKIASDATQAFDSYMNSLGKNITTRTGEVVEFKGAVDDLNRAGRGEGVGKNAPDPVRIAHETLKPLSASQRRELELIGKDDIERVPLLQDRLKQLNNQMKDFHGNQEQRLKILTNIKNTEAEIAAIYTDQTSKRQAAAEDARQAADAAREKAERARQEQIATRMGWLDFGVERAQATKSVKDDVKAFRAVEAALVERVRQEGRTLDLVRDLWRIRQRIKDANKGETDPLAGLRQVSSKHLAGILAAGTGLGVAGRRRLSANISGAEIQPVVVSVNLDGREVGRATTKQQTRTKRRTAKQTSGHRG